jgi:hypothetical protein
MGGPIPALFWAIILIELPMELTVMLVAFEKMGAGHRLNNIEAELRMVDRNAGQGEND